MSEGAEPEKIVIIDDDYAMRLSCEKILRKMGLDVAAFEDGAKGLEGVATLKPAVVVVDLKMPGISGMEVIAKVHEMDPQIVIVVITGYATIDTAVEAMKQGAYDFLPKPFLPDELRLIINRGLERRRLALESQRLEIERAFLKRQFVAFVSHQLQTPLAAIHQYLDVMKDLNGPEDAPRRREWLDRCLKRTAEMQALIRDWLTLARIEGNTLTGQKTRVDLREIVPEVLKTYEEMAAAEQVELASSMRDEPLEVWADRNCVAVVFDNLITNAIKYNRPGGKVIVTGSRTGDEVTVDVADTGVGIHEKHLPFLFEELYRVRGEGAKRTSGTGLGLHISHRIVTEMGGKIEVTSEPGVGSTFRVRLPAWNGREI